MDSTAANYNAAANVNTNTWCVPSTPGCMNPYLETAFSPGATVHVRSMCRPHVPGCMDSTALNYNPHATFGTQCYQPVVGCLNDGANAAGDSYLNYGCTGMPEAGTTRCTGQGITVHAIGLCLTDISQAGALVNLQDAALADATFQEKVVVVMEGNLEDYSAAVRAAMIANFCRDMQINDCSRVELTFVPSSVTATFTVTSDNAAAAAALVAAINSGLATAEQFNAIMAGTGAQAAIGAPQTITICISGCNAPPPPASDDIGAIVGGAVGGAFGGLMLIGFIFYMYKKRQNTTAVKTVVPA